MTTWRDGTTTARTPQQLEAVLQTKLNNRGAAQGSTSYAIGDMLVYRGRRILVTNPFTTSSGTVSFISAANYIGLEPEHSFYAADFGSLSSSPEVAIQAALTEAYNINIGARVLIPQGIYTIGATIDVPWGCVLEGAGKMSTVLQPANGLNAAVIRVHTSTGAGDANGMFAGVRNIGVNGRKTSQSDGGLNTHGILISMNPVFTGQTGTSSPHVEFFDPHCMIENVAIRSCLGDGLHLLGRSAHHIRDVWSDNNDGYGFYSTFDTTYVHCEGSTNGKAGWLLNNGSQRLVGCKAYNNGIINGDPGFEIEAFGSFANLSSCDSQNNAGPGYRVTSAIAVNIHGTADGNGNLAYGFGATQAVKLDGAIGAIINIAAVNTPQGGVEIGAQRYGLLMVNSCTGCSVTMSNAARAPATILGDIDPASTISGNHVTMNSSEMKSVTTQAANYTLALTDAGSLIETTKATAFTLTVPANATIAFPIGTVIEVTQYGAGQVTLTPAGGVTLTPPSGAALTTRAQTSTVSLRKRGTNEWIVAGDLTPALSSLIVYGAGASAQTSGSTVKVTYQPSGGNGPVQVGTGVSLDGTDAGKININTAGDYTFDFMAGLNTIGGVTAGSPITGAQALMRITGSQGTNLDQLVSPYAAGGEYGAVPQCHLTQRFAAGDTVTFYVFVETLSEALSITTANGNSTVTCALIQPKHYGMPITGTGIPASSYVGTVVAGTSFTLSSTKAPTVTAANATASGTVLGTLGRATFNIEATFSWLSVTQVAS